jgi:spore photoproduct lyase
LKQPSEEELAKRKKRRRAAEKAWETIRKRERQKSAALSKTLQATGIIKISEPCLVSVRSKSGAHIIHEFNKTPTDIACGPFWELRWAFGCPFDCAYCFLRGTMRGKMQPKYININHVLAALETVFSDDHFNGGKSAIFNTGELSDSWMNPKNMIKIVDKFEEQKKHKVLTLTKFGVNNDMVKVLTEHPRQQTITAFSINATEVAKLYENHAPSPASRIQAASQLARHGYDVRVRIDPIIPVVDWKKHYEDLVFSIFSEFEPSRIILGTPRGLRKTIIFAKKAGMDVSWVDYLERKETGWGWKLPFQTRLETYRFFYDKLQVLGFPDEKVSMCKENLEMWDAMGLKVTPLTCNCYGRG